MKHKKISMKDLCHYLADFLVEKYESENNVKRKNLEEEAREALKTITEYLNFVWKNRK